MIRIFSIALFLLAAPDVLADIYKCVDQDGNIAYQQTPCPVESETSETLQLDDADEDGAARTPQANGAVNRSSRDVEACKGPLRDAIDQIEAEMLNGYSPEQGEEFKSRLRGLTDEMRACE